MALEDAVLSRISQARDEGRLLYHHHDLAIVKERQSEASSFVVYLESEAPLDANSRRLTEMFCRNVAIAWENLGKYKALANA